MAKRKRKKKVAGVDIDWYLISIERLKQIALVILLMIFCPTGLVGLWQRFVADRRAKAASAARAAAAPTLREEVS